MDKSKSKFIWIGAVILILIIAGFLVFSNNNKSKQVSVYTCSDGTPAASPEECVQRAISQDKTNYGEVYGNVPSINQTTTPTKHAKVEIITNNIQTREVETSHTIYRTIIGEVKNNGDRTANGVKIIATLYDGSNQIVGSEYAYAEISDLKISQVSPFKMTDIETNFQTYKLQVDWSEYDWSD